MKFPCVVLPIPGRFLDQCVENCENEYRWRLKELRKAEAQGLIRKGIKASKKRSPAYDYRQTLKRAGRVIYKRS